MLRIYMYTCVCVCVYYGGGPPAADDDDDSREVSLCAGRFARDFRRARAEIYKYRRARRWLRRSRALSLSLSLSLSGRRCTAAINRVGESSGDRV